MWYDFVNICWLYKNKAYVSNRELRQHIGMPQCMYCYFRTLQQVINSDFDDHHDSPKGEVNPNDFVNCNDVSDISKNTVDDNKSLPAWRALEVQTL